MKPRALYFALFIILAAQGRFISIVLTDSLSFSDSQVGWVLGFGIISGLFSTPFWSLRADTPHFGCKRALGEMVCLHFLAFSLLPLARALFKDTSEDWLYVFALLSRFFSAALISPCASVLDAYTLKVIEDKDQYGKERLFGAISWALANIAMGAAMDSSDAWMDPLHICMVFLVIGTLGFLAVLCCLPLPNDEGEAHSIRSVPSLQSFWALLSNKESMLFFLTTCTLVMGCATSLVENLLFLFMREDLGASYFLCGVSVVITVLFEIPLFFLGKRLLLGMGVARLLLTAMFCYVTRVIVYTLVSDGWAVLAVEPLHGVTYALLQTASVAYVQSRCEHEEIAQGQGLLSLFKNLGSLLGTVLGSRVMEELGSKVLFRAMALIVTVSMLILACNNAKRMTAVPTTTTIHEEEKT